MQHPNAKTQPNRLKSEISARLNLTAGKNHLGELEQNTYAGWKAACKKVAPGVWFDGDKDIGQAMAGDKPFRNGHTVAVGEWDGEKGSVFKDAAERVASLTKSPPDIKPAAKASLVALQKSVNREFDLMVKAAYAKGISLQFDVVAQSVEVKKASTVVALTAASHIRWNQDHIEKIEASKDGSTLLAAAGLPTDIQSKLTLANALSNLIEMAVLDDAAKQQIGRMIDSVELQLSLEIDRLERENDAKGGTDSDIENTINLLDTIMRGETQERIEAVQELYNNQKYLNMVTAAHLIRVLTSINDTLKANP